jgi:hypothetical protein
MVRQLERILRINREVPPEFLYSIPELLGLHALNVARFLLGPVAAALALWGLLRMVRGRSGPDLVLLAGLAGVIVSFIPLRWPLLRYDLPLLPFLCLAAGVALVRLPRAVRWPLGAAAAVFPLAASVAQLQYIRTPHPANQALAKILTTVPEGTAISRMAAELPPLDRKVYPMSLNPYLDDLSKEPPEWVLTANLPDRDYPKATRDLLGSRYDTIAEFRSPRVLSWATLGESGAPHDWKYTHPHMVLYRRRSP